MSKIERWADRDDDQYSGIKIDGLTITWAEIDDLTTTRRYALDCGLTPDLLEDYERDGGDYAPGSLRVWLEGRCK